MALVKCPECGKDVSNQAIACPNCGLGIKDYFDEEARKKARENKMVSERQLVKLPKKPQKPENKINNPKVNYIIALLITCAGILLAIAGTKSDLFTYNSIYAVGLSLFLGGGIGIALITFLLGIDYKQKLNEYNQNLKVYSEIVNDFEHYKDQMVDYEMRQFDFHERQKQNFRNTDSHIFKCPTCGSANIKKISGTERAASVVGLGLLSKKINKTFKCNNCGYTW